MTFIQAEPSIRRSTLSLHRSHVGRGKCSQPFNNYFNKLSSMLNFTHKLHFYNFLGSLIIKNHKNSKGLMHKYI